MKNIKKIFRIIAFSSFALALFSVHDFTLSWFVKNVDVDNGASAQSAGAYFAGGDGTKETPYLLTNQRHFYNLAWLQYLGYFNQDEDNDGKIDKQYYFRLSNGIDCKSLVIPPIGTTKYPFLGSFDGGNYTISNFKISDTYSELVSHPSAIDEDGNEYHSSASATINYCSITGTFGVIGSYDSYPADSFYETSIPSLSNLYLDDVTISTKTSQVLVGAIAGYVNATIDNCGVHYVTFKIAENTSKLSSFSNVSGFALIGSYNKEKYSWDGDTESGDTGYGTSTDIRNLYYYMGGTDTNDKSVDVSGKEALPFRVDDNDSEDKSPTQDTASVQYSSDKSGDVSLATNKQAAKNNIGYYSGNGVKVYRKSRFTSLQFMTPAFNVFSTPSQNVIDYLTKEYTALDGTKSYNLQYMAKLTSSSSGLLSNKYNDNNSLYLVENANVNDFSCTTYKDSVNHKLLMIPRRCIWVAPKEAGTFKLVLANIDNKNEESTEHKDDTSTLCSIGIYKLIRSTPKDYSSYFTSATLFYVLNGVEYTGEPITIPNSLDDSNQSLLKLYYYSFDVSQKQVDEGVEFALTTSAGSPHILYMDIGNNGTDSDTRTSITNFDFVTKENDTLTKIKTYDSASDTYVENSSYTKSNVTFKIGETTKETLLAFRRLVESSGGVLYYQSYEILSSSSTGTKTSTKDEKCEKVS